MPQAICSVPSGVRHFGIVDFGRRFGLSRKLTLKLRDEWHIKSTLPLKFLTQEDIKQYLRLGIVDSATLLTAQQAWKEGFESITWAEGTVLDEWFDYTRPLQQR